MGRFSSVRDYLVGTLWALPTLAVALGLSGGVVMSAVQIPSDSLWQHLLFQGTAADARQLLIVVSATMITVTGIVFSLTVVSLQIASSQFSVRLLRTFMRDLPNQVVLAIFVCTFAYSTGGLYTVGERATGQTYLPRLAVSGSLWLAFLSTGSLVYFLHRLVHSIQIDTIMERVQGSTLARVDELYPASDDADGDQEPPDLGSDALPLRAGRPGYVQRVDLDAAARIAENDRVAICFEVLVGDYVTAGTPIGRVGQRLAASPGRLDATVLDAIGRTVAIGFERTLQQDIRFGLRQLVDIALRALSPAVNDPYTAVQVLHHLSAVQSVLAARCLGPQVRRAADGTVMAWLPTPGFAAYLEMACGQIRRCGTHEPLVLAAGLQLLSNVAARCRDDERRAAVLAQTDLIAAAADAQIRQPADRALVAAAVALTRDVARHPGRPAPPPGAFGMVAAAATHSSPDEQRRRQADLE